MMDPVVKELTIPAEPGTVFRRFTEELERWWPLDTHSVFLEDSASVRMEAGAGGRIVERSRSGEESEWGRLIEWDPPRGLAFTWHPGRDVSTAQRVEVRLEAAEGGTRLRLVHSGWEALGEDALETRAGYDTGWDPVLARLGGSFAAAGEAV